MNAKIYYLLQELKDNYSEKLLNETYDCLKNEVYNFHIDSEKSKELLNGQSKEFYNKIASDFVNDLQDFPEMFFLSWQSVFEHFSKETMDNFNELSLLIDNNSDATDYLNGISELENGKAEIALFHFNRIDNYVACYFIGLCYAELNNYENAILNFLQFIETFQEFLLTISNEEINFMEDTNYKVTKWNVHNELGFLLNRISEFEKAKLEYKKSLEIVSLEDNYTVNHTVMEYDSVDSFTIFINNYLLSLEKTRDYSECLNVLNFVISKFPNDIFYKKQKTRFEDKIKNSTFADEIINNLFRTKKPFNISQFQETKLISKEKALEDLIVEQIKYGFKVFNKTLEIYQDNNIFGRQYYIQNVNGILDLLLIDKSDNTLYIVELKRNEAGIEVVEQIEKYIIGLSEQLNRKIKGIICLHKSDEKLQNLVNTKSNIELYTYQFEFKQLN
ncbi:endonuclease NucS domain-containing protein [Flavobacterium psychrophilum]|uniref:endonuclease NucS domain-containing protein n=1 Tax=Flavobacterium psychrophilum TaxID=96345 RepID=UPI002B9029CE|nr:endonuclease NucS domain-containing protein [Flavobacterium psychrophilum]